MSNTLPSGPSGLSHEDEDVTPHGSVENVSIASPPAESSDRMSLEAMVAKASNVASNLIQLENNNANGTMKRSTSMSTKASERDGGPRSASGLPLPSRQLNPSTSGQSTPFDRDQFLRRSLTLTSKADRANLIHSLTERISQRMQQQQSQSPPVNPAAVSGSRISTHHVIPVNKQLNSPEGEKYGFGAKFKQSSSQYFDMSASYPNPSMNAENQKFMENLSSQLLDSNTAAPPAGAQPNQPQQQSINRAQLNSDINRGAFILRKTNGLLKNEDHRL